MVICNPIIRCINFIYFLNICVLLFALPGCSSNQQDANYSDLHVYRFEKDLFSINPDSLHAGVEALQEKYPLFYPVFIERILSIGNTDDTLKRYVQSLHFYLTNKAIRGLYDSCMLLYTDISDIEMSLKKSFGKMKNMFPDWQAPKVYTFISEFTRAAITYDSTILGIGLDMYLGKNYVYYTSVGFPQYISRKLTKEYIIPNSINVLLTNMYEMSDESNTLLDVMIYKGKMLYLMDLILEDTPDSLIVGYSEKELEWCNKNEPQIWAFFIDKDLLFSSNSLDYNKYVTEGPTSSGMPNESPGNIGSWVGWQIVNSFMSNNEVSILELMNDYNGQEALNQSGYKPRKFGFLNKKASK